jgi:hypothetical protein
MTANPPPRPALQRGADGTVTTAASLLTRAAPLSLAPIPLTAGKGKKHQSKGGGEVKMVVTLPKAVRKQLRKRAAEQGCTPEEAVARLVIAWLNA